METKGLKTGRKIRFRVFTPPQKCQLEQMSITLNEHAVILENKGQKVAKPGLVILQNKWN
jgi:hypothetical protein